MDDIANVDGRIWFGLNIEHSTRLEGTEKRPVICGRFDHKRSFPLSHPLPQLM